jgi:hypothetical protein
MKTVYFSILLLLVMMFLAFGCRVEQVQRVEGNAQASIIHEFPLAERCFDDTRVHTWEELKECLELTTNMKYTVDANGAVVEALKEKGE